MTIEIGLTSAKEMTGTDEDDQNTYRTVSGLRVLEVQPPDGIKTSELFASITHPAQGIVISHTDEAPAWVSAPDHPALEGLLADEYGCAVGKPADVEDTHWTVNGPPT